MIGGLNDDVLFINSNFNIERHNTMDLYIPFSMMCGHNIIFCQKEIKTYNVITKM